LCVGGDVKDVLCVTTCRLRVCVVSSRQCVVCVRGWRRVDNASESCVGGDVKDASCDDASSACVRGVESTMRRGSSIKV
jgi:hypothetical protein